MARDPKLSHIFEQIEVSEEEVRDYRSELADRLCASDTGTRWRVHVLWFAAAALAGLAFFSWHQATRRPSTEALNLTELLALSDEYPSGHLLAHAQQQYQGDQGLGRLNANLLLTRLSSNEQAIAHATAGMREDHRPSFRAYYLEFLLDYADELYWSAKEIEKLLDREEDPLCIKLFQSLLRLSS